MTDTKAAELMAAAERLRRNAAGEPVYMQLAHTQYEEDCDVLAHAYLATVAADDAVVMDDEFWKSLPLHHDGRLFDAYKDVWLEWTSEGYEDSYLGLTLETDECVIQLPNVKTRGQFRQLCKLLGIPLQSSWEEQGHGATLWDEPTNGLSSGQETQS